jgi:hypothetical protein
MKIYLNSNFSNKVFLFDINLVATPKPDNFKWRIQFCEDLHSFCSLEVMWPLLGHLSKIPACIRYFFYQNKTN